MRDLDALLAANRAFADSFHLGHLEVRPVRRLAVLTCMDSRYSAQAVLGLRMGDAHVIRNAGGRVTDDVIRSLALSAHLLGTDTCLVIHHTGCGLFGVTNAALRARVEAATGTSAAGVDFLPFDDIEASVREDVMRLAASTLLPPGYAVAGFVYDVRTGRLTPVA